MSPPVPARRRGGPTVQVAVDLLRHATATRSWLPLVVLLVAAIAALVVYLGQTVLPWAIYPAL